MAHNKRKRFMLAPQSIATRANRKREVRDLFNKLRKKYNNETVEKFFIENYFLQPESVSSILCRVDKEPVDLNNASLIYKQAMSETFNL